MSEFPELEQVSVLEVVTSGFSELAAQLPQTSNPQSKLAGEINEELRALLINITLYGGIEVNPYLTIINRKMAFVHRSVEARLSPVARLFGDTSELYLDLEQLYKELKPASTNCLPTNGGLSYRQRMEHVQNVHTLTKKLIQDIGKSVTLQGLQNMVSDLLDRLLRWLDSIDSQQNPEDFYKQSEDYAIRLLKIYSYHFQAGEDGIAEKYAQLAKDIFELGRDSRSGGAVELDAELPELKERSVELKHDESELS
jgi:hypothetical protein